MISLSPQQTTEIIQIRRKIALIHKEVYANVPHSFAPAVEKYHRELIEFKTRLEELCDETDVMEHKLDILRCLTVVENFLTRAVSDGRYIEMAPHLDPKNGEFLGKNAMWLAGRNAGKSWADKNYDYLDFYRKSYECEKVPTKKTRAYNLWKEAEARRDFYTGSMRQINHLIQYDHKPDLDLMEPRWEIYKISVSFEFKGKTILR